MAAYRLIDSPNRATRSPVYQWDELNETSQAEASREYDRESPAETRWVDTPLGIMPLDAFEVTDLTGRFDGSHGLSYDTALLIRVNRDMSECYVAHVYWPS